MTDNDKNESYDRGVKNGWEAIGPVHKQRFLRLNETSAIARGSKLNDLKSTLFGSEAFRKYLACLTKLRRAEAFTGEIRCVKNSRGAGGGGGFNVSHIVCSPLKTIDRYSGAPGLPGLQEFSINV